MEYWLSHVLHLLDVISKKSIHRSIDNILRNSMTDFEELRVLVLDRKKWKQLEHFSVLFFFFIAF